MASAGAQHTSCFLTAGLGIGREGEYMIEQSLHVKSIKHSYHIILRGKLNVRASPSCCTGGHHSSCTNIHAHV